MLTILFNLPSQPPSLIAGYDDFQLELARYLGSGSDPAFWTAQQIADMDRAIQEAYRYVLYPSRIPGGGFSHVWNWLRQIATMTTVAGGADAIVNGAFDADTDWTKPAGVTIDVADSNRADATLATGDLSQTVAPLTSGNSYSVTFTITRTAGTIVAVCGTRSGTVRSTSSTFTETIVANGAGFKFTLSGFTGTIDAVSAERVGEEAYTLPADFGSLHNREITYAANTGFVTIQPTSALDIRKRNQLSSQTAQPWLYALEWAPQTAGLNQRQRIIFYPTPDDAYVLTYEYAVLIGKLSKTNPYPLGGPRISQLMIEACKAVGMSKQDGMRTDIWNQFRESMADAIAMDAATNTERTVGPMRDASRWNYDDYDRTRRYETGIYSVRSTSGSSYAGVV